ncbi:hypothetical protein LS482_19260 [Sinomicrobium kalidii]|uniref:hypothetical protein n=1 Tax=Sinomicrobium kalidii TaxID=2900738 RepID=UPI001E4985FD|nr:hypothetical protein [Sinomicrobium kalidii]UGU15806.1 hypothetical protein LS482_19260 [Sinomicrobium kalidii]
MKRIIPVLSLVLCSVFAYGQKMEVKQGDFGFLKGQQQINVEFVYDNLKIHKDSLSEEEYVKTRIADLEEETKGKGKNWEKQWTNSREFIFAPKFLELMNRYLHKKENIYFATDLSDTKYTLVVETVWIYPGWNAAVMRQPSKVSTVLRFVETANPDHILAEVTSINAPGRKFGGTFSNEDRIGESYAKTGKSFAKLILKNAF